MQPTLHRKHQPVSVDILTPVAIGSGQTIDPMRYTICREGRAFSLHLVDVEQWLMDNSDDAGLLQMLESNQFLQIRNRINKDLENPEIRQRYSVARRKSSNSDLFAKFSVEMERGDDSRHQLQISSGLSNPLTNRLLLAGSSIKGAIRTAVLDYLDQKYQLNLKAIDQKRLQREIDDLLGKISDHAFKSLRVQDCEILEKQSCLVSAEEKRLNGKNNRPGTPKSPTEAISPTINGEGSGVRPVTALTLCFNSQSSGALTIESQGEIRNQERLDWSKLCKIVTDFYRKRFKEEFQKYYRLEHLQRTGSLLEQIRQKIDNLPADSMLLRVGHYSHSECLTISNGAPRGRSIKDRRTGNTIIAGPGTTRTLADGNWPFGWIILTPTDEEALRGYQRELQNELMGRREVQEEYSRARTKAAEEAKEKSEADEKARLQQQQLLKKRLLEQESMSPLERLLDELKNGKIQQQTDGVFVNQLLDYEAEYSQLDNFAGEEKWQFAQLLKEFYVRDNKWSGRLSDKQKEKVKKISGILDEEIPGESVDETYEKSTTAPVITKLWPNKKKSLPVWIKNPQNLQKLDAEQLKELKEDVNKILKIKGNESAALINNRLKELQGD